MNMTFNYRVTFKNGVVAERNEITSVALTGEELKTVVKGLADGCALTSIPGIESVLEKMRLLVEDYELHMSIIGVFRDRPLKRPREITNIEYSLPKWQQQKLIGFRDHMDYLDKPEESMVIYRADGSYVTIKSYLGEVHLTDSRQKTSTRCMSVDRFLSRII